MMHFVGAHYSMTKVAGPDEPASFHWQHFAEVLASDWPVLYSSRAGRITVKTVIDFLNETSSDYQVLLTQTTKLDPLSFSYITEDLYFIVVEDVVAIALRFRFPEIKLRPF